MLLVLLWILIIYFVISAFIWPAQRGRTVTYSTGYVWSNVIANAVLALVLFWCTVEVLA